MFKNSIFIFNSIPLSFIISFFKLNNFILTPGEKGRRATPTVSQHRLSQFFTALEGMGKSTIFDSFHNYEKIATKPTIDHTKTGKIEGVQKIHLLFKALEDYYRFKLNIHPSEKF
jgi:hypothetical protein